MFWPPADERRLLGRFYLSGCLGYGLAVITPFQFAYLYLTMERPDWAVLPLIVSSAVALLLEIPTGILSDRWSRKKTTLLGYGFSGVSWALIPFAVAFEGEAQLIAVCACFALDGLGAALASGAEESWAVDNLRSAEREDLVEHYFARSYSFESLGSIVAGVIAFAIVLSVTVSEPLLHTFWLVTAGGQMLALAIVARAPEFRVEEAPLADEPPPRRVSVALTNGMRRLVRNRPLLFFLAALMISAYSDSAPEDAFVISMLTKGMDARALAPLAIAEDVIGLLAPILAVALARQMGASRFLAVFLILPAIAVSALFLDASLWVVVVLCLVLDACAVFWDPIAETHLHRMISSTHRATTTSVVNQLTSLAELAGLGVLALLLGERRESLEEATPDLLEAFAGVVEPAAPLPAVAMGLSLPDFAIVVFVFSGLLAVPFVVLSMRKAGPRPGEPLQAGLTRLRKGLRLHGKH